MTIITHVTRRLSYTEEQLDQLAHEFAEYAALDIADIVRLRLPLAEQDYRVALIATEIAHAIRCTIGTLTVTPERASPYRSATSRAACAFQDLNVRRTV
jgi:NAD(P)H-dependent FMN reductase